MKTSHQRIQRSLTKKEPFWDSKTYSRQRSAKPYHGPDPNNHRNPQNNTLRKTSQKIPLPIATKKENKECQGQQEPQGKQLRGCHLKGRHPEQKKTPYRSQDLPTHSSEPSYKRYN